MSQPTSTVKKPAANQHKNHAQSADSSPNKRRLRLPAYRPLRLKRVRYPERLPSAWAIAKKTSVIFWQQRWLFLGIALIYGLLSIVFVNGLSSSTNVTDLKQQLSLVFGTGAGQIITGVSIFSSLLASGNGASTAAGAYQFFLVILVSLATIWAVRQVLAGQQVRLRDPFYKGMYPLVPFVLVMVVVLLQSLPFLIGGWLYTTVISNGIAIYTWERLLFLGIFLLLAAITVYMLCASLFALYIVTLPDMTPLKALRSARQLVAYRRGQVFRKLLFMPVALLVVGALIVVPTIIFVAAIAEWVFFAVSVLALVIAHIYLYTVYKELLA